MPPLPFRCMNHFGCFSPDPLCPRAVVQELGPGGEGLAEAGGHERERRFRMARG